MAVARERLDLSEAEAERDASDAEAERDASDAEAERNASEAEAERNASGVEARALNEGVSRMREMHRRLERRLERAGLDASAAQRVLAAADAAIRFRFDVLRDEEHFEVLHPARTLLVLLDDCEVTDAELLEAAPSIESEHDALRAPASNALARDVPIPGEEDALLEELIVASADVRLIALAERLDHARHLHLRPRDAWRPLHRSVIQVYEPVARLTHARLARRYAWWSRMFERRFLAGRAEGGSGASGAG